MQIPRAAGRQPCLKPWRAAVSKCRWTELDGPGGSVYDSFLCFQLQVGPWFEKIPIYRYTHSSESASAVQEEQGNPNPHLFCPVEISGAYSQAEMGEYINFCFSHFPTLKFRCHENHQDFSANFSEYAHFCIYIFL